jgi:hypothetical protein
MRSAQSKPTSLLVEFGKDNPQTLEFIIEKNKVADLWLKLMPFRTKYPLDDPERFYLFSDYNKEIVRAENMMHQCIEKINSYKVIIERKFTSVHDQEILNYIHNIFELYHGTLGNQNSNFFSLAPDDVKQALIDINDAVHRCESLNRAIGPFCRATWYGMPKIARLDIPTQKQCGVVNSEFGGVYLCQAGIGKRVLDLAYDNDHYIDLPTMFFHSDYYSADFDIQFYNFTDETIQARHDACVKYYFEHEKFFSSRGITDPEDVRIQPVTFKLAQLDYAQGTESAVLDLVKNNQYINSVTLV